MLLNGVSNPIHIVNSRFSRVLVAFGLLVSFGPFLGDKECWISCHPFAFPLSVADGSSIGCLCGVGLGVGFSSVQKASLSPAGIRNRWNQEECTSGYHFLSLN